MDKKGHWYTDKNGQHYFVEDGQTPQEGWEASKRRKMIDGGKYKVSEDGDNWEDVDEDTYNKYEADKSEFDENIDDDFGFDEEDDEYNREMEKAQEENAMMSEAFDDDYEEEFNDYESEASKAGHILEDAEEYIGEENANKIEYLINQEDYKVGMFEDAIAKNLGKNMSNENALMQSIQDVQDKLFGGDIDKDLMNAINMADDDILDKQFGKDTPERKLAGAVKDSDKYLAPEETGYKKQTDLKNRYLDSLKNANSRRAIKSLENKLYQEKEEDLSDDDFNEIVDALDGKKEKLFNKYHKAFKNNKDIIGENNDLGTPEDFSKKTARMPNGKEMSLFDFAHNITNYLDTDTASAIIADKFGVSENDAKAYLESSYNREGSKEDYDRKLKSSYGTKDGESIPGSGYIPLPKYRKGPNGSIIVEEGPLKGQNFDSTSDLIHHIKTHGEK